MKMKVLITGATGFLGKVLVRKLKEQGHDIWQSNTSKGNLFFYESLSIFNNIHFDVIFHLAAYTKAGDWCVKNSGTQWITNQLINTNILRYWKEENPQAKMVCMGTSCSYDPNLPLAEIYYEGGIPEEDLYYYAQTKKMLLTGLRALEKQFDMKWLYAIPSTLYGPGYEETDNHFIFDLVRKICNGKHEGKEVILWGDGKQKRELIHVDDFVTILLEVLHRDNEVINIGRGKEYPIRKYAQHICDIVGFDRSKIVYDINRFVGVKSKCLDISKLKEYVSDIKFTPIKTGLKSLVKWQLEAANYGG
tara:strand:+ start:33 stop:947 length:915 start_codon:yes stop_codon:yes gene_type:complete